MKRAFPWAAVGYAALLLAVLLPGRRPAAAPLPLIALSTLILLCFLAHWFRRKNARAAQDITLLVYALLLLWEALTSKWNVLNPIVVPAPEDVCMALYAQRGVLLRGIGSSMELLVIGFGIALPLGVGLGMLVGWIPRLRECFFPVAKVLSPVPPSIYSPYIVALMPTFRSASAMILVLGLFWPTFLNTVVRVGNMEKSLLDSARVLCLSHRTMLTKILLPYLLPGVVGSLHVQLSTSFLLLTLAEMMGAASGMGYFVRNNADYANYANVVAGIFVVGVVVTLLNRLITWAEARLVPWKA